MKLALMSDLHLDHYTSGVSGFVKHLQESKVEPADVCVLAGDIADGRFPDEYLALFIGLSSWYDNIIIVTGNHDYYRSSQERTHRSIEVAIQGADTHGAKVHHLNKSSVEIDGRVFHGGTLWYRHRPDNFQYEHWMNDTRMIPNLNKWVYEEQRLFEEYLEAKLAPGDIVVSHHLPHDSSVDPMYQNSPLNRFFVCNMDRLIEERRPALCLHGHTHTDADYQVHQTRIVCHPRGYPRERLLGPDGYVPKLIEL